MWRSLFIFFPSPEDNYATGPYESNARVPRRDGVIFMRRTRVCGRLPAQGTKAIIHDSPVVFSRVILTNRRPMTIVGVTGRRRRVLIVTSPNDPIHPIRVWQPLGADEAAGLGVEIRVCTTAKPTPSHVHVASPPPYFWYILSMKVGQILKMGMRIPCLLLA